MKHSGDSLPELHPPKLSVDWYLNHSEPALEPERRIIDAHFHFSDHWAGYGLEDQLRDVTSGHRIEATIFMQVGWKYRNTGPEELRPVGETEAVVQLAEDARSLASPSRIAAGIVGYADLRLGAGVADVLDAHIEAGKGRFRGVRASAARHEGFKFGVLPRPPVGLYADPDFRAGLRTLASMDLVFDAWVYHTQLQDVLDLARAVPEATIVVDHIGGLLGVGEYADDRQRAFNEWRQDILLLATCANVFVKIGGYGIATFGHRTEQQSRPPTSSALADIWRPSAEFVIEAFGAERCMFESNFPVDRSSGHYSNVWNAFKRIAGNAGESEKANLFYETASRIYKVGS